MQALPKRVGIVARRGICRPSVPRRRSMRWKTTGSQVGSQDTTMVGAIGSCFDFGGVSKGILEPRDAGEEIGSVGVPSVREGELDSGADVSCLPASIGADTYPLQETRLSMCGGHHVAAGGGKLHELGARILGLEAGDVRGDVANLLVRFRVMDIGTALLSAQDLSRCGWETVFPADCGDAYFVRKASGTRITLVKKRRAWCLRVNLKPHSELSYADGPQGGAECGYLGALGAWRISWKPCRRW